MMKRLCILLALLIPVGAWAQSSTEFGVRASVEANVKIKKGVHFYAEEEVRFTTTSLDNLRHTLGFTYKPFKGLKMGVGYTLINSYKSSEGLFKSPRHRFFADVTGSIQAGDFQFAIKERFQLTHRTGSFNVYQSVPNAVALKSKLTVKYKGFFSLEPYASFEMRTVFNEPWGSVTSTTPQWNSKGTKQYYDYSFEGYTHVYNNRYRGEIGCDIAFDKWNSLKPFVLLDFNSDYEIDTNAEGARLFSAAYVNSIRISLGVSYVHNF